MTELHAAGIAGLTCQAAEQIVRGIWSGHFGRDVSPYDDFFELGGDSLAMIEIVAEARRGGLPVRSSVALRNPTPARLAEALTVGAGEPVPVWLPALASVHGVVEAKLDGPHLIARGAGAESLYVVHSASHVNAERAAAARWESPHSVKGFRLSGGRTASELADLLLDRLRAEQPEGPYRLAGFGHGAVVAFELARRLAGQVVLLALIRPPITSSSSDRIELLLRLSGMVARRFGLSGAESAAEILARCRADGWYDDGVRPEDLVGLVDVTVAAQAYEPEQYDGPAVLVHDVIDAAAMRPWRRALTRPEVHQFDHGIESPLAILRDERLAHLMRKALAA